MCRQRDKMILDLQRFGGGGAPAAPAETAQAGDASAAETQGSGEPPADGADRDAAFETLIRGEYKAQYAARLAHAQGALQLARKLAEAYGLPADDYAAIAAAAQPAEAARAEEHGETPPAPQPEQPADGGTPAQAPDRPAPDPRRQAMETAAQRICGDWVRQGMALRDIYPGFDFAAELKRADFAGLLRAGVPVKAAYEACHLQEILGGAMQYTADKVAAGVAARIADRANRPAENGATPRAGAVLRPDVNKLTRAQREQIARRVAHGETIRF